MLVAEDKDEWAAVESAENKLADAPLCELTEGVNKNWMTLVDSAPVAND